MSYKLQWEPNGVYWKYDGIVSGKEIIMASTAIYGDPRFDNLKYKLADFLDVESIAMDDSEVTQIAFQHRAAELSNPNIKTALVINAKTSDLAKKFTALFSGSSWEVRIFEDLETANNWVGRKTSI